MIVETGVRSVLRRLKLVVVVVVHVSAVMVVVVAAAVLMLRLLLGAGGRRVVRLCALSPGVAMVQDGEGRADGGRTGGDDVAAAARVHSHLVRRKGDGQRGRVGLQNTPEIM